MMGNLLSRGMLVGFLAGLLVFGFARTFGEPQVDRAIAFESAMDAAENRADALRGIHHPPEPELVSRRLQAGWGLFTGVMVYATAFGGLFALVFALANGRMAVLAPRATAALLACCGFVSCYAVPNLKYPANPPAVGHPDTIALRTGLYAVMLAASVAAMVGAVLLRRHLSRRPLAPAAAGARNRDPWSPVLWSALFFAGCVLAAAAILPAVDEVPPNFPATLLWRFRLDSAAMQLILWTTLGLGFGFWVERVPSSAPAWHRLSPLPRR